MSKQDPAEHPESQGKGSECAPLDRRDFLSKSLPGPLVLLAVLQAGQTAGCRAGDPEPPQTEMAGTEDVQQPTAAAETAESTGYKASEHNYAMAVDPERCLGCGRCVEACKTENDVPREPFYFRTWIERYVIQSDGETVVTSPDGGISGFPKVEESEIVRTFFVPKLCNHCANPPCVQVCPVGATFVTEDGVVLVDEDYCIGCRYCIHGCPYGARFMNPVTHTADKCTFCYHRLVKGLLPACVEACPAKARIFGDHDDPNSEISILIKKERGQVLNPEFGNEPKVYYLFPR